MRIAILTNSSNGLYGFRNELLMELLKDHEVYILTPFDGRVEQLIQMRCHVTECSIDRRGINPIQDLLLLKNYHRLLRQIAPALVITYTIKPNIYGGYVARRLHIPYAANVTGLGTVFQKKGILKKVVVRLYKAGLKKAKVVFFENKENLRILVEEKIVMEKYTCLLHGAGINLDHYKLAEYPKNDGRIQFLFMGRVMKEKGIQELLQAAHALYEDEYSFQINILGIYEENYQAEISKYEAEGWLCYHGYQKDVRPFVRQCHCFVLPSWHEGMANTNLEAAAMGRPIITSNIPGCREAVIEKVSGFLCEPHNWRHLYHVMKLFLSCSYEEREKMGMAGRKHMEDTFAKEKVVRETIKGLACSCCGILIGRRGAW